jgi:hypothetical protein
MAKKSDPVMEKSYSAARKKMGYGGKSKGNASLGKKGAKGMMRPAGKT